MKKKMCLQTLLLGFLFIFFATGCSSQPGTGDLKNILQQKMKGNSSDLSSKRYQSGQLYVQNPAPLPIDEIYELTSCKKTNAQIQEVFGVKIYVMKYEATLKTKKNIYKPKHSPWWTTFKQETKNSDKIPAGTTIPCYGEASFEHTENGWQHDRIIMRTKYRTPQGHIPPLITYNIFEHF